MDKIVTLNTNNVLRYWNDIKIFIEKSLKYNSDELDCDDVLQLILIDKLITIAIFDSSNNINTVSLLEIITYPKKKVLHIFLCSSTNGSENKNIFIDYIVNIAKQYGADSIYIDGRKGFVKQLKEFDFKEVYTVLERKI
jgi:hypothetical protein